MGAPSKRARKVRAASEFDVARLRSHLSTPREGGSPVFSWSLEDIFAARNAQMRGDFRLAARIAESMRTDDALFAAHANRVAPQRCIKRVLKPAKGGAGAKIAFEAEGQFGQGGVAVHPDTLANVADCIANHHVAFGTVKAIPRDDGSRVDSLLQYWPIEHVRWDAYARCFMTRVDLASVTPGDQVPVPGALTSGHEVPIIHGDGRWVIFQKTEVDPFKFGALLPASLVWARHAFAMRDWAKGSVAHGAAKVVGEMPEGVALQNAEGELTREAAAFLELLRSCATSDAPYGIRPAGSKTEFVTNTSTAWQIWHELAQNAEKAAARIYLGTDGVLGAQGGAPGVDISALFGVASTIIQGDLECIERGINTGVIEPWCALNFGSSKDAPVMKYMLPDPDADAARESLAKRKAAFFLDVKNAKETGFEITQAFVDKLAKEHGVDAPPLPALVTPAATTPGSAAALRSVAGGSR